MSTNPFLPEGRNDLPAQRYVLAALALNQVVVFEETEKQIDSVSFDGRWDSPSLNQELRGNSLVQVSFKYSAEGVTNLTIFASSDGGATWPGQYSVSILGTVADQTSWGHAFFDSVTGPDLRFRVLLDTDVLVNVYSYSVRVIERGAVEFFQ
jgi:hypothetical protein